MTVNFPGLAALTVGLAASTSASAVQATFDPHQCSAIRNVEVPYDVSVAGDRIAFAGGGRHMVVAPAYMEIDGHRFADAALSPAYYQNVRRFLHNAGAFPKTAAEFGKSAFLPGQPDAKQNFLSGATAMCRSILNLADDQKKMHSAFAKFVAPVEVTLNASRSP
jgi:hypothetical protein